MTDHGLRVGVYCKFADMIAMQTVFILAQPFDSRAWRCVPHPLSLRRKPASPASRCRKPCTWPLTNKPFVHLATSTCRWRYQSKHLFDIMGSQKHCGGNTSPSSSARNIVFYPQWQVKSFRELIIHEYITRRPCRHMWPVEWDRFGIKIIFCW
jgi:hypothetical protein